MSGSIPDPSLGVKLQKDKCTMLALVEDQPDLLGVVIIIASERIEFISIVEHPLTSNPYWALMANRYGFRYPIGVSLGVSGFKLRFTRPVEHPVDVWQEEAKSPNSLVFDLRLLREKKDSYLYTVVTDKTRGVLKRDYEDLGLSVLIERSLIGFFNDLV